MRSKAQIAGHPLHPILIAFPVAFIVATVVLDLWGVLDERPWVWAAGGYANLATIGSGLLAAVPGLIDYFGVVPPRSSAKRRATKHMAVNVTALLLMGLAWAFRPTDSFQPNWAVVVLEGAALLLMSAGGWMGGTLVYRNQIGVDHRYAHAGKWREVTLQGQPGETIEVPGASDLQPGQMMLLHVADRRVVLARTAEGFSAFDDRCSHRGGSLAGGILTCQTVTCPWHGSQFDTRDGPVRSGPAETPIATYRVTGSEKQVLLTVSDP